MAGRGRKRNRTTTAQHVKLNGKAETNKRIKLGDEPATGDAAQESSSSGELGGCVLTLGAGDTGQLGLGEDVMERTKPGLVDLPAKTIQVAAGGMHTVCLTSDGKVHTFGCNDEGALGRKTPDEDDCMTPGVVELDEHIVMVSAGDGHSAAVTKDGAVLAWGTFRDANGPLGLCPDGRKSEVPVAMLPGRKVRKIVSGNDHLVCLTQEGEIFTLGCGEQGQLGRVAECFTARGGRKGLSLLLAPAMVRVKKKSVRFDNVWAGQYVTFAKARDTGDIYAWGLNNYYQLGFDDMANRFVPECVKSFPADKGWKQISGGQHHTLALDKDGGVYSLGRKEYGRLGLGEDVEETMRPTPLPALQEHRCTDISCGTAVSFSITDSGEVYAWGMGTSNQLGQAEDDDLYEPTVMRSKQLNDRVALQVSAGGQHTVILAADKS